MTYEFEYLMHLLSCGARGLYAQEPKQQIDWELLLKLANEQSVKPIIAYAIKKSDILCWPEQDRVCLTEYMRHATTSATVGKIAIINLLGDFRRDNVKAILLKGFAVAECYAIPESRISGKTLFWVSQDDEQKAYDILKNKGFDIETKQPDSRYTVCHHAQMGYLYLYVTLYDKNDKEIKNRDINEDDLVKEPYIEVKTVYGKFYTLGKTDHLIFLIMDLIKNFVTSGINLRMIMDFALFYKVNSEEIDTGRIRDVIRKLKCCGLIDTLLYAMVIYCDFIKTDFILNNDIMKEDVDFILKELETCGRMNYSDVYRMEGFSIYDRDKVPEDKNDKFYLIKKYIHDLSGIFQGKNETHINEDDLSNSGKNRD